MPTSIKCEPVASPCAGVCKLDAGRAFCVGCLRTIEDIASWPRANAAQQRAILCRAAERAHAEMFSENPRHKKVCGACSVTFACGASDERPCWCDRLPHVDPVDPAAGDCLCPVCLGAAIEMLAKKRR